MTARGRGALVVGIVLMVGAILGATATVYTGRYNCGSALSAHEPEGAFASPAAQSRAEDRCNGKITTRRVLVAIVGGAGLVLAVLGAVDPRKT